ncbi:hypothetical protein [Methanobrevibacter sp.]|uniref:hypothetical protein n=1 Tax=Methanobrevibacter sp. TaxID=66852 RepID=UPI00386AE5FC
MNKKHIDELVRFEFTDNCKDCKFRKELGFLEYSCGFVIDFIRRERFEQMKNNVYDYMKFSDDLSLIDPDNIFFNDDGEWGVMLTFKTNLKPDKKLILRQLRAAILDSIYFNNVNFGKDSLYYKEFNKEPDYLQSTIEEFGNMEAQ